MPQTDLKKWNPNRDVFDKTVHIRIGIKCGKKIRKDRDYTVWGNRLRSEDDPYDIDDDRCDNCSSGRWSDRRVLQFCETRGYIERWISIKEFLILIAEMEKAEGDTTNQSERRK